MRAYEIIALLTSKMKTTTITIISGALEQCEFYSHLSIPELSVADLALKPTWRLHSSSPQVAAPVLKGNFLNSPKVGLYTSQGLSCARQIPGVLSTGRGRRAFQSHPAWNQVDSTCGFLAPGGCQLSRLGEPWSHPDP